MSDWDHLSGMMSHQANEHLLRRNYLDRTKKSPGIIASCCYCCRLYVYFTQNFAFANDFAFHQQQQQTNKTWQTQADDFFSSLHACSVLVRAHHAAAVLVADDAYSNICKCTHKANNQNVDCVQFYLILVMEKWQQQRHTMQTYPKRKEERDVSDRLIILSLGSANGSSMCPTVIVIVENAQLRMYLYLYD